MGYIEQSLARGEVVHYRTRLHWVVLVGPVTIGLGLAIVGLVLIIAWAKAASPVLLLIAGLACFAGAAIAVTAGVLARTSTEMAVTNRRVLMKSGIIARRTVEVMLAKVEGVAVEQTVMGRLTGFGTVTVRGTGGTLEVFPQVSAPLEFRRQVQEQIELHAPPRAG